MEKMQFENGTLVTPAKVTIDGVDHTVTPAVYEGNTPFTAENINQMQDNIETNRYKITLEADLADNSELTIPANYKVGTDSLQVYFEGCLLEKGIHYLEVGTANSISNKIQINNWGESVSSGYTFTFIIQGNFEEVSS